MPSVLEAAPHDLSTATKASLRMDRAKLGPSGTASMEGEVDMGSKFGPEAS